MQQQIFNQFYPIAVLTSFYSSVTIQIGDYVKGITYNKQSSIYLFLKGKNKMRTANSTNRVEFPQSGLSAQCNIERFVPEVWGNMTASQYKLLQTQLKITGFVGATMQDFEDNVKSVVTVFNKGQGQWQTVQHNGNVVMQWFESGLTAQEIAPTEEQLIANLRSMLPSWLSMNSFVDLKNVANVAWSNRTIEGKREQVYYTVVLLPTGVYGGFCTRPNLVSLLPLYDNNMAVWAERANFVCSFNAITIEPTVEEIKTVKNVLNDAVITAPTVEEVGQRLSDLGYTQVNVNPDKIVQKDYDGIVDYSITFVAIAPNGTTATSKTRRWSVLLSSSTN